MMPYGRRLAAAAGLPVVVLLAACGSPADPDPEVTIEALPRALTAGEEQLIAAGETFAFDFLRELAGTGEASQNLFVSPLSASMALGMALAGAEADTYEAMRGALRLGDLSREQVGASYGALLDLLAGLDPAVTLEIGNSVWLRTGFEPEAEYRETVERDFDARIEALDFSDPVSVDVINGWVNEATDGLIEGIVTPPIDPLTVAFLINAIYFRGFWTLPFDADRTAPGEFWRTDGSSVTTAFMNASDRILPAAWTERYQAVELPYGGEAFAMTVVVPSESVGLDAFVEGLDAAAWRTLVDGLSETTMLVSLPKFTIEYEKSLNDVLAALGMDVAFQPGVADFSRMHRDALAMQLHISRVKQKAFVDVDEEGTRAAAVTSVEVGVTSLPPTFRADRPFLFAIRERLSGTLLFVGLVHDPSAG